MATMGGAIREQVARPGGKTYVARRPPRVDLVGGRGWDDDGVIVSRTHDVDLATALAALEWQHWTEEPLPPARQCWLRLVPWSTDYDYDYSYLPAEPGERGAFPAVEFARPTRGDARA